MSMVYRFLQKLWEGQVPVTALAGPVSIAKFAFLSAKDSISTLLMFMTMFSANLAVVNFLPIPVLDGGHMVFLAYEGIFRRPPSERVVVVLHLAGFAFIVGLMSFLILLDTNIIPRNL
jgi:regulator of sigma E protease